MMDKDRYIDVTDQVKFGNPMDESLPITQCVCGKQWDYYHFQAYDDGYDEGGDRCNCCGRRFIFRSAIRVYEVVGA